MWICTWADRGCPGRTSGRRAPVDQRCAWPRENEGWRRVSPAPRDRSLGVPAGGAAPGNVRRGCRPPGVRPACSFRLGRMSPSCSPLGVAVPVTTCQACSAHWFCSQQGIYQTPAQVATVVVRGRAKARIPGGRAAGAGLRRRIRIVSGRANRRSGGVIVPIPLLMIAVVNGVRTIPEPYFWPKPDGTMGAPSPKDVTCPPWVCPLSTGSMRNMRHGGCP